MSIWKLDYSGDTFQVGNSNRQFPRGYSKENACTLFNVPFGLPKPTVGNLSVEHRLLHYFITYVLVPHNGNHGLILDEDLEIMWHMANGHKINWVHLFIIHMQNIKPGNTKGLPYAILWTAIFKYLGIDLSQARKKKLGYSHCIDTHVLNLMKRGEIPQQEDQEDNQGQEQAQAQAQEEEHTQPPQAGPSMQDMMEVLLRIEQNQTSMGSRLDKIEKNQARMLRKIRRVEAFTFSEDEAEDDDDEFWS
ncbi:hypothetical protein PIB30_108306 [Stylosanthes scabra]|uniref:Uncharacterized protein n=2 Tax=Stylosanthes scabra TaxID=79078 RepID=A0ABU6Y1R8_9FABA|nr:hypothetical protein [Stylosanthes scabra]